MYIKNMKTSTIYSHGLQTFRLTIVWSNGLIETREAHSIAGINSIILKLINDQRLRAVA